MGSERASTVRRREAGKDCWRCGRNIELPLDIREVAPGFYLHLPPDTKPGYCANERLCPACEQETAARAAAQVPDDTRVHVHYFFRGVPSGHGWDVTWSSQWVVQFLTPDGMQNFGRYLLYPDDASLRALLARLGGVPDEEDLRNGRGGCEVRLSREHYTYLLARRWGTPFPERSERPQRRS